jgi:hypothetical protein
VKKPYIKLLYLSVLLGAQSCSDVTVPEEDVGFFEVEEVTSGIHFDRGMDKKISIFGINVYKYQDAELWALVHAATILAEYLDSDEDGTGR